MPSPSSSSSGFALWAVLQRPPLAAPDVSDPAEVAERLDSAIRDLAAAEVVTRGIYDVSGLRADADLMVWLHGPSAEGLQRSLRELRRRTVLGELLPVWNAMGVHRDARPTTVAQCRQVIHSSIQACNAAVRATRIRGLLTKSALPGAGSRAS